MRFTILHDELLKALNITSRAVTQKSAQAELNDLKFTLDEKGLSLTGSDYNLSIKTFVPYSKDGKEIIRNYKEGGILLAAKYICDIVRKIDSDEISFDVVDESLCIVSDGKSEFKLSCGNYDEYPDLDLEPNGETITLNSKEFVKMVDQTAFAAAIKETRKSLIAVNLKAADGVLTATATDASRLAKKDISIDVGVNFEANVPAKMIVEVSKLIEDNNEIQIAISSEKALFIVGSTIIATRLIADPYPNTKNIVPKFFEYTLEVNANEFVKAIDRVSVLAVERENAITLKMNEDSVEICSKASIGSATEKISTFRFEGSFLEISFNSEFALSAIRALGSEDITLAFVGEMKPFVIKNDSDASVTQVVTPMRTY